MSILRIYFTNEWRDQTSLCPWALCDEKGALLETGNTTLANLPKGHECIGIAAAGKVLSFAATLPPGRRRHWQTMLPFVAEEHTLAEPEENHVVPGVVLADGRRMLVVIDKPWFKHIVDAAHSAKLSMRRIVAETFLPKHDIDNWVVVWNGRSGFVKTDAANGIALDVGTTTTAPLALHLCLSNTPQLPKEIELRFSHDTLPEQRTMPQWPEINLVAGADWDWRRAAIPEETLNLLWGEFTPRAKIQEWWPKIRPAAFLLLAIFLVEIVGSNMEWAMLVFEKDQLTKNMQRTFRATFGDTVALVNPPLQMQRNLADLRHATGLPDAGDFLPLLGLAGHTLAALPMGSVLSMHYEAGRLDFDLRLAQIEDYANLKKSLQSSGAGVRISDIRESSNGAEARLTVLPEKMQ